MVIKIFPLDVYSPVAGEILEVNTVLESSPGKVNESPFDDGWFIKLKLDSEAIKYAETLLDETAYKKVLEDSKH